jgi:RNA polymerase sigma-70 factor (ECF subfamily)
MDDAALIEATLRGDVGAFGTLVQRYQHVLVAAARHLTRHADDAEDLAQDALVDAYRNLRTLKDRSKFRGWLFGILRHKCLTYLQRRKPEALSLDDCGDLPALPPGDAGADLAEMLDALPLPYREILAARYVQELSYEEIAEALGTSVNVVRVRCCRAKERLRALFGTRGRLHGGVTC